MTLAHSHSDSLALLQACVTPYVAVLTSLVLAFSSYLQPVIAVGTVIKATIFITVIGVVGYTANQVHVTPTSDFNYLLQPFLIGSVALGGSINL